MPVLPAWSSVVFILSISLRLYDHYFLFSAQTAVARSIKLNDNFIKFSVHSALLVPLRFLVVFNRELIYVPLHPTSRDF